MRSALFLCIAIILMTSCKNEPSGNEDANLAIADSLQKNSADTISHKPKDCIQAYTDAKCMDSIIMLQTDLNLVLANKAIQVFADYAYYCENDTSSPVFLVKTAQIAMAINNPNQAKVVLDKCISNYPKFKNRPAALFLMARLYDESQWLNDPEQAKRYYQKIIEEFPKSEWAENAKNAIPLIGKSDEEIVKEFERRSKSK